MNDDLHYGIAPIDLGTFLSANNPRSCSIPDCSNTHHGKGFCQKHYTRFRRRGDPLKVEGTPKGEPWRFYEGVVLQYEGDDCLTWPHNRNSKGYGQVLMGGKSHLVSRLVCEDINGPAPTPEHQAAHSCGRGHLGCVTKRHLSWKTPKENQADRLLHGTHGRGERSSTAKITELQAREILSLKGKESQVETAKRFGVSHDIICQLQIGRTWVWLREEGAK